ncbi:NAD(P)-dependent dehydrogenase (short-subunit alcohol dehydrogenase family) [Haloactinopolyspora alba]|uniref:NAD(P)-dependent dehydrogenase (Short-subunit alcohol dehydrogenase family) n=1 Tax=Haloactinopolyspora alba TaxID=648780 RepID=A0A2P8E9H4_9ACTN|nr:SDR family oxidoreductase [Haloactinopolyspora alba]PSL06123.1 NAD(P)-dependent dehydrogenase (short-subunit alcohol dehydrogenase family) [Haloactinopolyspora alba]
MTGATTWDPGLAGQVGIVTGAAGGIGLETARLMAEAGARLRLVDRSDAVLDVADELGADADVRDLAEPAAGAEVVETVVRDIGPPSFVVNAAGIQAPRRPLTQLRDEDWSQLYATNLRAVLNVCRSAASRMRPGSAIVNVASVSGTVAVPGLVPYGSLKAAVAQLGKGLAVELAPDGVRVNAVAPGYVRTAMTRELLDDVERGEQIRARIPMRRVAEPVEVARVIVFLLSPLSSYVTGEVVHVDGGFSAQ